MSTRNASKDGSRKSILTLKSAKVPLLTFNDRAAKQIADLCAIALDREWSAIIFYKVIKSIKDEQPKFEAINLYPMDIGESAYTSAEYDEDYASYITNSPELLSENIQQGVIHSHARHGVFFSPTDMEELEDNTEKYNYYLSVIVNNAGKCIGKVSAVTSIPAKQIVNIQDENREEFTLEEVEIASTDVIIHMDVKCEFEMPETDFLYHKIGLLESVGPYENRRKKNEQKEYQPSTKQSWPNYQRNADSWSTSPGFQTSALPTDIQILKEWITGIKNPQALLQDILSNKKNRKRISKLDVDELLQAYEQTHGHLTGSDIFELLTEYEDYINNVVKCDPVLKNEILDLLAKYTIL